MYDIIYNFLINNIFNSLSLSASSTILGQTITLNEWLSHSITIVCMILIVITAILFIKWLFKLGANVLRLR